MNQRPQQPLDAEERALAKALPRLHGRTSPGPDLDASILAAAETAVRPANRAGAPATNRPQVRWIAPAALAASMVLAVGMAWQLRPLPAVQAPEQSSRSAAADTTSARIIESAPNDAPMPMAQMKPAPLPSIAPEPRQASSPPASAQEGAPAPDAQAMQAPEPFPAPPPPAASPAPAPSPSPSTSASGAMSAEAAPTNTLDMLDARANERAMRPAPATQASASKTSSDAMVRESAAAHADKANVAGTARPTVTKATQPPVSPMMRNEAEMAADAGFVDDPETDIPPATAASPVVRDAWLHRIGELLEQGKRQDAKASLVEFRRRYPATRLPPALQALEIEP